MKTFSEQEAKSDIRCQVANEIKIIVETNFDYYIEDQKIHYANCVMADLIDGDNGETIIKVFGYVMDMDENITFYVGKDFVIKQVDGKHPTGSNIEEILSYIDPMTR